MEVIMSNKTILGIYSDDELLVKGARQLRDKGVKIKNVFSPFPIHGIDALLGIPRTRLAICSFIYGVAGCSLAILMMWYMMIYDWPSDVGGKPNFALYMNLPSFIPITFECTVLCAAHLMVLTFLLRSKLLPGVTAPIPDVRCTDDRFVIQVSATEANQNDIISILKQTGASEIK